MVGLGLLLIRIAGGSAVRIWLPGVYEQEIDGEVRFIYHGETDAGRLPALVVVKPLPALSV